MGNWKTTCFSNVSYLPIIQAQACYLQPTNLLSLTLLTVRGLVNNWSHLEPPLDLVRLQSSNQYGVGFIVAKDFLFCAKDFIIKDALQTNGPQTIPRTFLHRIQIHRILLNKVLTMPTTIPIKRQQMLPLIFHRTE